MSDQDSIAEDEYVLRRIHKQDYDSNLPIPVQRAAFIPTKADSEGISVYREKYVTAAQVAAAGRAPGSYYVARLSVRSLRALNLTVVPTEGALAGHAVIPELSRPLYERQKPRLKETQNELTVLASQAIVHKADS